MVTERIVLLFMAAACCMTAGMFLQSRSALLYCMTPQGKRKFLGSIFIREKYNIFFTRISFSLLEKSDAIYYDIELPEEFARRHYMKELTVATPYRELAAAVQRKMHLRIGLRR